MHNPFPVHHSPHVCNKTNKTQSICVTFTSNWLDWTGLSLSLGLVVFSLGLITDFWSWSKSRTLWSRSWPWSHYVLVSLTSLACAPAQLSTQSRNSSDNLPIYLDFSIPMIIFQGSQGLENFYIKFKDFPDFSRICTTNPCHCLAMQLTAGL